jgi:hypothetical protein
MRQETTWGAAAVLAIAAAVGISSYSSSPRESTRAGRQSETTATKHTAAHAQVTKECSDLVDLFQAFLLRNVNAPRPECYEPGKAPPPTITVPPEDQFQPKFVIATLPDPLHTHFPLLFDRFVEAIQQGAQDEGYQYDSSWLPWETEEPALTHLSDQDTSDDRKKNREDQPGVLLFHAAAQGTPKALQPYRDGLFVFIVGEDPTDGIHRKQFENALNWIAVLQNVSARRNVAILGPTFSGSFPSLAELLAKDSVHQQLMGDQGTLPRHLPIYSGSATSNDAAGWFTGLEELKTLNISFHSFLQDDDTTLDRFCRYLEQKRTPEEQRPDLSRFVVLSEDESAYGYLGIPTPKQGCKNVTWLYYPRDISTLRAAYQKQSIFSSGTDQQTPSTQRNNLPTDLADPGGEEHDTVRTYAGNQTPLSQEAELLGIVGALRSHHAEYVVLRSSNTLDPLFLANFLRREYPEARVVVLNSDLLFQRGQDALALSGVMTLSTYPLIPWEQQWTARPPVPSSSHRVFPENSTEATYIASRLLLHSSAFGKYQGQAASCTLIGNESDINERFVPSIFCTPQEGAPYVPVPDYAPPFWTEPETCQVGLPGESCKPATWLSVITKSGSWPLAALNDHTLPFSCEDLCFPKSYPPIPSADNRPAWPPMPVSMKVFLTALVCLALFHFGCCLFASFTAKPAFRAHFATNGSRHLALIFIGSLLIALMALIAGWGCGAFSLTGGPLARPGRVFILMFSVWICAVLSLLANVFVTLRLNSDKGRHRGKLIDSHFKKKAGFTFALFLLSIGAAILAWVWPLESALSTASRVLVYWRSMNLTSGVSPVVPFLLLTAGLYIWFWYSLHGLALFGPDRPRLPWRSDLAIQVYSETKKRNEQLNVLRMFSQEEAAAPAEDAAMPLATYTLALTFFIFALLFGLVFFFSGGVPVRSLGARTYAKIFCLALDICFSLILGAALQLWLSWSRLRQLLVFLDRMPLRRTLGALRGFSWGSVWKMSGNVLDVRYKLLSRQLECLHHLDASLQDFIHTVPGVNVAEREGLNNCLTSVDETSKAGTIFAKWYSENYRNPSATGLRTFEAFQERIATTVGQVLTGLLLPAWRKEDHSLILIEPSDSDKDQAKDEHKQAPPLCSQEHIRNAEELTCLVYLGFAQNVLGRIRTIALGGLFLFVAVTIAVSSYPFDPRPTLSGALLLLFVAFGAVIIFVYADMHRDSTLSHITNTNPGELGSEFWFKILGFGAAPLLGLIATIFPELSSFLFSWLQPGLTH